MTASERIAEVLKPFPRHVLAHAPTPLEPMRRLTAHLAAEGPCPPLLVKRDDCTGLATGGNKARQLEYSFGAALAEGADTVVTTGAVQSNYMRSVAAAAARLGLDCHVQLENRVQGMGEDYHQSGNVLLDRLFGAHLHHFPVGEDEAAADRGLAEIADGLRREGRTPYAMTPSPDVKPLGALGYMWAAAEVLDQCAAMGMAPQAIIAPSGSAATHVGTLMGLRLAGSDVPVHGICVRRNQIDQAGRVRAICAKTAALLGVDDPIGEADVICRDAWLGPGYGQIVDSTREAIEFAGHMEGLIVDPVYTAKVLAGMIGLVREGAFDGGEGAGPVVYLFTGGLPAVFAYRREIFPEPV